MSREIHAARGTRGAGTPEAGGPPAKVPAFLFGMGVGGFVDGIVLHQLLQWHHMLSHTESGSTRTVPGLELNTLADGLFHSAMWVLVVAAAGLAIRARQQGRLSPDWRFHGGLVLAGWGVFNIVEGLVNHQLLKIHHVRDDLGGPLAWDLGFLVLSVVLVVAGRLIYRGSPPPTHPDTRF
ncbi:DUF2243 domain-containing protein [Pseudarthrobacter phenanthrenivorans]|uniref:DUF2243 domain-containing protein n=1 Tax=Pseudarthrobacter phenanthrenivorans TaxID=361575 RepID=UPI00112BE6D9|nr:DUF2243 domain-containing protein [Pseudarthrobacter phenanthrenivorans]TPV52496.1 DUF2243 domain-containing protein [Pseudarthrobacter phenanthrenivorans]